MIHKNVILCPCHEKPVRTVIDKKTGRNKYYCDILGTQLFNRFKYGIATINLPDTENGQEDFKKRQGGDDNHS